MICKRYEAAGEHWLMTTLKTQDYPNFGAYLGLNSFSSEGNTAGYMDIVSNGFIHQHNSGWNNATGASPKAEYIYAAWASDPFKTARAS